MLKYQQIDKSMEQDGREIHPKTETYIWIWLEIKLNTLKTNENGASISTYPCMNIILSNYLKLINLMGTK